MAGKPKKRIDYAGWSVDIFSNDVKIDKLLDAHGWTGFGIYFYLCQMAFGGEGYYYEWGYDLCASTARKMGGGVGAGTVKETVDYCLQIGLFDKGLFDGWGVLTSKGIQKSYLIVLKSKNRKGTEIYEEYWLLDTSKKEDYQGVVFIRKNQPLFGVNSDSLGENGQSLGVNSDSLTQEESKVKESKVKQRERLRRIEDFISAYPKDCNRYLTETAYCDLVKGGVETEDNLVSCAENYAEACKLLEISERYIKNAENFLKEFVFEKYLPGKYRKPTKPASGKSRNAFCDIDQHDYDFDKIERALLERGNGG